MVFNLDLKLNQVSESWARTKTAAHNILFSDKNGHPLSMDSISVCFPKLGEWK